MIIFGPSVHEISQKDLKMHQPAPVSPTAGFAESARPFHLPGCFGSALTTAMQQNHSFVKDRETDRQSDR